MGAVSLLLGLRRCGDVRHRRAAAFIHTAVRHVATKAIDKEKLPQLRYTTGRNSYWLANVARLLDAILTPGQRIDRQTALVMERTISYQYYKTSPLPILVTDTRYTRHRHSSPTPTPASLAKLKHNIH